MAWHSELRRVSKLEERRAPGAVAIAAIEFGRSRPEYAAQLERMRQTRARLTAARASGRRAGPALVTIHIWRGRGARDGRGT